MQKFKDLFTMSKQIANKETESEPLLISSLLDEQNENKSLDLDILKQIMQTLCDNDLLNNYLMVNKKDDEIHQLKAIQNMRIPMHSLILFVYDDNTNNSSIDGCINDDCDYLDGILIGLLNDTINIFQNVDINIHLDLCTNNGKIEQRELLASYIKYETFDDEDLYDEWRFWLLTTGEQEGFYKDFTQRHTYIIFPTHPFYNIYKRYYEMPGKCK